MEVKKHCGICDHKIYDIQTGAVCGLTKKAPDFVRKCNYIKPEKALEAKIVEVHTKLKLVTKKKADTISHFIFYSLINVGVLTIYYFLYFYEGNVGTAPGLPFIIFLFIGLLGVAIGPINTYMRDYKIAKNQQKELHAILKIYKLDYEVSIKIFNEAHGDFNVEKRVKIFRVG